MSISECERLDDYLLGGLSENESARFEAHLAGCAACRDELQRQRQIDRLLAQGTGQLEPVPSSLIDRIEEQYCRSRRRRVVRLACCLSAAALLLLALTVRLATGILGSGADSQPIVQEHPGPAVGAKQVDPPRHERPPAGPVATVTFADPSEAILVPLETKSPNISIVWVYPTVKPVQAPKAPDND